MTLRRLAIIALWLLVWTPFFGVLYFVVASQVANSVGASAAYGSYAAGAITSLFLLVRPMWRGSV